MVNYRQILRLVGWEDHEIDSDTETSEESLPVSAPGVLDMADDTSVGVAPEATATGLESSSTTLTPRTVTLEESQEVETSLATAQPDPEQSNPAPDGTDLSTVNAQDLVTPKIDLHCSNDSLNAVDHEISNPNDNKSAEAIHERIAPSPTGSTTSTLENVFPNHFLQTSTTSVDHTTNSSEATMTKGTKPKLRKAVEIVEDSAAEFSDTTTASDATITKSELGNSQEPDEEDQVAIAPPTKAKKKKNKKKKTKSGNPNKESEVSKEPAEESKNLQGQATSDDIQQDSMVANLSKLTINEPARAFGVLVPVDSETGSRYAGKGKAPTPTQSKPQATKSPQKAAKVTAQPMTTGRKATQADFAADPYATNTPTAAPTTTTTGRELHARFGFDHYVNDLKCRKHGCDKLTNCYDGSTVICPRCGVNSFVRYCSLACLLDPDMRIHLSYECGRQTLSDRSLTFVDRSTLITRPASLRPYIRCPVYDSTARHRQAVYHSSNAAGGDYFVFNDYLYIPAEELRAGGVIGQSVVGVGDVIAVVNIVPDFGLYQGKTVFQEVLEDCLLRGVTRPDKCLALVDLIISQLLASNQWSKEVSDCLVFQMEKEFGYVVPSYMLMRFNNGLNTIQE